MTTTAFLIGRSRPLRCVWTFLLSSACAAAAEVNLNESLLNAARRGDSQEVRALVERGADINAKTDYGVTPLLFAAGKGHREVVEFLLGRGADVNVKDSFYGNSPLSSAAYYGHAEIVGLLLEKGATAVADALGSAIYRGHTGATRELLRSGSFDSETLDQALALALRREEAELANLLARSGAAFPSLSTEESALYAGTYAGVDGASLTVRPAEGRLTGQLNSEPAAALRRTSLNAFQLGDSGMTVIFEKDSEKIIGCVLRSEETEVRLTKRTSELEGISPDPTK